MQTRGHNHMINRPTSPVFELIQAFIPELHICKFQEDPIKTKGLKVMTRSEIGIFSNQGDISVIDRSTSLIFEFIRAFIPSLTICKFQEDMIKIEGAIFPL